MNSISRETEIMGEIADDIIEGFQCSWCGVCFEEEHGYPVVCSSCWNDEKKENPKAFKASTILGTTSEIHKSGVQKHIYKEL